MDLFVVALIHHSHCLGKPPLPRLSKFDFELDLLITETAAETVVVQAGDELEDGT